MRHANQGCTDRAACFLKQVHRNRCVSTIERSCWFVGEHDTRRTSDRTGDRNALLLSDAQVIDPRIWRVDPEYFEECSRFIVMFFAWDVGEHHGCEDVLENSEALEEMECLKDHPDVPTSESIAFGTWQLMNIGFGDRDRSSCRIHKSSDEMKQGALAAARVPGDDNVLSLVY